MLDTESVVHVHGIGILSAQVSSDDEVCVAGSKYSGAVSRSCGKVGTELAC